MTAALRLVAIDPRSICSYCKADQGPAPAGCQGDTHGICEACRSLFFPELAEQGRADLRAQAHGRIQQLDAELRLLDRQRLEKQTLQAELIRQWPGA